MGYGRTRIGLKNGQTHLNYAEMKVKFLLEDARLREKEKARAQSMATREVPWFARIPAGIGGLPRCGRRPPCTRGTWRWKSLINGSWRRRRRPGVNILQQNQIIRLDVYIVLDRTFLSLLCNSLLVLDSFGSIKGIIYKIKLVYISLF